MPFTLSYDGVSPVFAGPAESASDAAVLGRATIGSGARLGVRSVVRADGHFVRAGDDFFLGERSTVHIAHNLYPAVIGDRVTVGSNAVIHACTLGSDVVVEEESVVLDGSTVGDNVAIESRSIVFPRSKLETGKLYAGMPAKPVRDLRPGEVEERARLLREKFVAAPQALSHAPVSIGESILVAGTATVRGAIVASKDSSIWFGCVLDATDGEIVIGAETNIQDNTVIRCRPGKRFEIGPGSTIGHNVTLGDCTIGARSLIGIGSVVAPGTIVEDEVFLAAGAETTEGQILESGWLWGKRPAEKLAPLDQGKRELIALTVEHYCGYARAFADAQRALGR